MTTPTRKTQPARRRTPPRRQGHDEFSAPRQRAHRRRGKKGAYIALILLLFAAVSVLLSCTVLFKIKTVTVVSQDYTAAAVVAASGVKTGDNLFMLRSGRVAEAVKAALPYAEQVTVRKKFPSGVVITVTPPAVTARVHLSGGDVLVSGEGRVLEIGWTGDGMLYEGLENARMENGLLVCDNPACFEQMGAIRALLAKKEIGGIDSITVVSGTDSAIVYDGRVKVRLGSVDALSDKLTFVKTFLEEHLGEAEVGVLDATDAKRIVFNPGEWRGLTDAAPTDVGTDADAQTPESAVSQAG